MNFHTNHQYHFSTVEDLQQLLELDEVHWAAIGAPSSAFNCDKDFLAMVDSDHDGRILASDIRVAIKWLFSILTNPEAVAGASSKLDLSTVDNSSEDGKRVMKASLKLLNQLGKATGETLSIEEVKRAESTIEAQPVSGKGVVLPTATEDPAVEQFVADIIATVGGTPHPSGGTGVNSTQVSLFMDKAKSYVEWLQKGVLSKNNETNIVMPLADQTSSAWGVLTSLRTKFDLFFAQCEATAFAPEVVSSAFKTTADAKSMNQMDPQAIRTMLDEAVLAIPKSDGKLDLKNGINPRYEKQVARFVLEVVEPVLGSTADSLTAEDWQQIQSFFAPHEEWLLSNPAPEMVCLTKEKIENYLTEHHAESVASLISESDKATIELTNLRLLKKLILYQSLLMRLVNNFVSFPHLYSKDARALFEVGTLHMDGRKFNFCVKVDSRAEHSKICKNSNIFLLYGEVAPAEGLPKFEIATPVTSGNKGHLFVNKRGVFQDLSGKQHDVKIVEIIDNPISLSEAIFSPFTRIGKIISGKIEAMTAVAEKKLDVTTSTTFDQTIETKPEAPPAKPAVSAGGMLVGGGLTLACLGSALAYVTKTIASIGVGKIGLVIIGAVLAVMAPISIIGICKLRRRDLSTILEGCDWAINVRLRLTRRQGVMFTTKPSIFATMSTMQWLGLLFFTILLIGGVLYFTT